MYYFPLSTYDNGREETTCRRIASTMELGSTEDGRHDKFPVGMRVLAVDDNPTCLRKLEELLLRCKYHGTCSLLLLILFFTSLLRN